MPAVLLTLFATAPVFAADVPAASAAASQPVPAEAAPAAPNGSEPGAQPKGDGATAPRTAYDPNEKICRMYRPIGTNRAERLCRTRAQIDREREHAEKELDRVIQRDRF